MPSYTSSRKVRKRASLLEDNRPSPSEPEGHFQPVWGNTTKLVVGLGIFASLAWLFLRFQNVVGLILAALLIAYLLYPLTKRFSTATHLSWRMSVTIIFIIVVVILLGLITLGGLAVVEQSQSLIRFLDRAIKDLPDLLDRFVNEPIVIGPFQYQFQFTDVNSIADRLLSMVQPLLGQAGSLVGSIASGTANFLGLFFFTLLVAYFILAESRGAPSGQLIQFNIPGYREDVKKFTSYLGGIWNAFLRGQLTLIVITIMVYLVLLGGLGLRFFIGLALLAGLARFVPYVGPTVAWTTYGLVAYFQTDNLFGLPPLGFVLLVVGLAWITDLVMDNLVGAPLMGNALRIHPAAVMVSALVGANLFGLVGVVLAAPVVATLKLVWAYMFNRLIDQDPWRVLESSPAPVARPLLAMFRTPIIKIRGIWKQIVKKYQVLFKHSSSKT